MTTGTVTRRSALVLALGAALLAAGCTAIYRNHGYVPTEEDLAQVAVGKSTRDDVATAIGRPSSTGVLEGSAWYYVGSRWKYYGGRAPQEIDRQVLVVSFSSKGVVENVERIGLVRELLGSIGKVSAGNLLK